MSEETIAEETATHSEFEREPVPRRALLGLKSFLGQYAGEHTAGTELMIGPLFVASGVSAFNLIVGLLLGNLLAVLSWRYITTPIAVRARLTLYHQLEGVCGKKLVILYNLANGIMFCFLAGAMITVSTTAVGVFARFPMPELNDVFPSSVGWVIAALGVGAVISIVAAMGYNTVAKFANYAAPWMTLVFIAFGLIALREFIVLSGMRIDSLGKLWTLLSTSVWKGGEPLPGQMKFTFWHVVFFAWFCNMAMHIGMSDLSVLRFAKKASYGWTPAAGVYLGHFAAWLAASLLYALQLQRDPTNTSVLPGPMAYQACGLTGLLCVVIAGWTTANPTIYRAGLAFQAIFPKASRYKVTLITGGVATLTGMFPAIAMKLLGFVALYGLILMPMGAVIFIDFWFAKRFGFKSNYARDNGVSFYVPAFLAWVLSVMFCLLIVFSGKIDLYFISLPGWFIAAGIYVLSSWVIQKQINSANGEALPCSK